MLSHDLKRFNLSRCLCAAVLLVFCACAGPVRGVEPGCCTKNSDCKAEACWPDIKNIDDGNSPEDYRYYCDTKAKHCVYQYDHECPLEVGDYPNQSGGCPVTPCKQICNAPLEGDAVASVPSDAVKSDGKKGGAIRGIVMLIVIIMTSLLIM